MNMWWLVYPLIGVVAGLLSGLLGIGGGIIIIPALAFLLPHLGFPQTLVMHMAVATSVACIVPTTALGLNLHHRRNAVRWPLLRQIILSILAGAFVGAFITSYLSTYFLKLIFGTCLFLIALYFLFNKTTQHTKPLPSKPILWLMTFILSSISALLGLGGGVLLLPFFTQFNINMREVIGTTTACSFFIGMMSLIILMSTGLLNAQTPPWSVGYVYIPAVVGIVIASFMTAPLGVRLAHHLPAATLKRILGLLLIPLALWMILR